MQKGKAQDIWFLLLISAIKAHLRLVGEISRLMERFIHVIFADSSADVCPVIKQRLNIKMAESSLALPFLQMCFFLIVV
ncbi:MAG: hypothetical protein JSV31_04770 [Desulfobacterales bacterium]|nr:MAG: hypothetical protein JSV31_04770 [Desulfobacterales bacterium]